MDKTASYQAILFRQRAESPVQAAFVAPSAEIDSWARVPTKRTGNVRNFQRAQIEQHVKEVTRFFKDDHNASPTAVVVGFDPIRSRRRIEILDVKGKEVEADNIAVGTATLGAIRVTWFDDGDPQSPAELRRSIAEGRTPLLQFVSEELEEITGLDQDTIDLLRKEFNKRALEGKPKLSDIVEDSDVISDDDDGTDAELPPDLAALGVGTYGQDDIEEPEVSAAVAQSLAGLSPSDRQVVIGRLEFLASVQADLVRDASTDALTALNKEVRDELKPALLIDGQHRVTGTKDIPDVPFLVCALPHAAWPELAFQFIVTNRTARRVQESLLINIVGNSLSKAQRASIEDRLRDAGIRVGLIEAIMKVHEDPQSPFFGTLAFGMRNEPGFLDAAAMRNKVVQPWYERQAPIRQMFDHFCQGKTNRDRTDYWKSEELWFEFFITFWSAVRERYAGSNVFSSELRDDGKAPVSRLMSATVLKIFQETVLGNIHQYLIEKLSKDSIPFSQSLKDANTFSQLVINTLKTLTPEFFQGWTITGFDGSKGAKDDLSEAIRLVLEGRKTVAQLQAPGAKGHRLYKEAMG